MKPVWLIALAGVLACLTVVSRPARALSPAVEAIGGQTLVLEDETTVLSLFNLGNPAALTDIPQSRMDWMGQVSQRTRRVVFTTGPLGDPSTWDALGRTLTAEASQERERTQFSAVFDAWEGTGYGGWISRCSDAWVVQLLPRGGYRDVTSPEPLDAASQLTGGGTVRASWALSEAWSLGAGLSYAGGMDNSSSLLAWADALGASLTGLADTRTEQSDWQGQAGLAWRLPRVFDPGDRLDIGLLFETGWLKDRGQTDFTLLDEGGSWTTIGTPWSLAVQSIYHYLQSMDLGLRLGYVANLDTLSRQADGLSSLDHWTLSTYSHLNYDLHFRVRLPMAKDNDLRFGVTFGNRGASHPYPTGRLELHSPDAPFADRIIDTGSSSIGIGTAVVPADGWLVALEYRLGSSKSREADRVSAETGFSNFSLGMQLRVAQDVFLRAGYSNQRLSYEHPLQGVTDTTALRLGVGLEDGPMRLDVTAIGSRIIHSPMGYDDPYMPEAISTADEDQDFALAAYAGFSWRY